MTTVDMSQITLRPGKAITLAAILFAIAVPWLQFELIAIAWHNLEFHGGPQSLVLSSFETPGDRIAASLVIGALAFVSGIIAMTCIRVGFRRSLWVGWIVAIWLLGFLLAGFWFKLSSLAGWINVSMSLAPNAGIPVSLVRQKIIVDPLFWFGLVSVLALGLLLLSSSFRRKNQSPDES